MERAGGYVLVGVGRQRTIMDQHLFLLQGTAEPWAKLIARAVSPEGLNNI